MTPLSEKSLQTARAASGVVWTGVFAGAVFALGQAYGWAFSPLWESLLALSVFSLFLAALTATAALPRPHDLPRWTAIGLPLRWRAALRETPVGLAAGAGAATLVLGGAWVAGWVVVETAPLTANSFETPPAWVPLLLVVGAAGEELTLRGYALQQLARAATPLGAALAGAVLFGALHLPNPSSTPLSAINTALFGLLFALAIVRHRSLWLSFGAHLGWNLALAVLGANISGLTMRVTAWRVTPIGVAFLSGGEYGPEASALTTVVAAGGCWLLWRAPALDAARPLFWDDAWRPARSLER